MPLCCPDNSETLSGCYRKQCPDVTEICMQPFYRKMFGFKEGDFPVTEDVTGRTIALPFFNNLEEEQIDYVVNKLKEGIKRNS